MEVWDVRNLSTMNNNIPYAEIIRPMSSNGSLDVAVSWDASMIALLDISPVRVAHLTKQDTSSMFRVFNHRRNDNVNQQSQSLSRCNFDDRPDLKTYVGNGRFHFVSNPGARSWTRSSL